MAAPQAEAAGCRSRCSGRAVDRPPGTCRVGVISMWPMLTATGAAIAKAIASAMSAASRQLEALDEALADLRAVAVHMREDVGRDAARADLGDADALAEGVDAQLARQHADRRLGRVVGRVAAEVVGAGDRRDVDDMAAVARHHAGHDQAAEVQHGAQVHVDQEVDVAVLGLQEGLRPVDARVVDQDVELDLAARAGRAPAVSRHVQRVRDAAGPLGQLGRALRRCGRRRGPRSPSRQNRSTTAAPMPDEAPVTRAVL